MANEKSLYVRIQRAIAESKRSHGTLWKAMQEALEFQDEVEMLRLLAIHEAAKVRHEESFYEDWLDLGYDRDTARMLTDVPPPSPEELGFAREQARLEELAPPKPIPWRFMILKKVLGKAPEYIQSGTIYATTFESALAQARAMTGVTARSPREAGPEGLFLHVEMGYR
jgi:hypothetical protein